MLKLLKVSIMICCLILVKHFASAQLHPLAGTYIGKLMVLLDFVGINILKYTLSKHESKEKIQTQVWNCISFTQIQEGLETVGHFIPTRVYTGFFWLFIYVWLFYIIDADTWDKRQSVTSANTQHNTRAISLTNVQAASEMKLCDCLKHHQLKTTL